MAVVGLGKNQISQAVQRQLNSATARASTSMERLSTGMRINHASDDAAGLAISETLKANTRIYSQSVRNINDAVSALTIAESTLNAVSNITIRQKELAEQAASGLYSAKQRAALQSEATALTSEFNRLIATSSFNGQQLFNSSLQELRVQAGVGAENTLAVTLGASIGTTMAGTSGGAQASFTTSSTNAASQIVDINFSSGSNFTQGNTTSEISKITMSNSNMPGYFDPGTTPQQEQSQIYNILDASNYSSGQSFTIQTVNTGFIFYFVVDGYNMGGGDYAINIASSDDYNTVANAIASAVNSSGYFSASSNSSTVTITHPDYADVGNIYQSGNLNVQTLVNGTAGSSGFAAGYDSGYFTLSNGNTSYDFYFRTYFPEDGQYYSSDPSIGGHTSVAIDVTRGESRSSVLTAIGSALNNHGFGYSIAGNSVFATNNSTTIDTPDITSNTGTLSVLTSAQGGGGYSTEIIQLDYLYSNVPGSESYIDPVSGMNEQTLISGIQDASNYSGGQSFSLTSNGLNNHNFYFSIDGYGGTAVGTEIALISGDTALDVTNKIASAISGSGFSTSTDTMTYSVTVTHPGESDENYNQGNSGLSFTTLQNGASASGGYWSISGYENGYFTLSSNSSNYLFYLQTYFTGSQQTFGSNPNIPGYNNAIAITLTAGSSASEAITAINNAIQYYITASPFQTTSSMSQLTISPINTQAGNLVDPIDSTNALNIITTSQGSNPAYIHQLTTPYFTFNTSTGAYYAWLNVDGLDQDPNSDGSLGARTGIQVTASSQIFNQTAEDVTTLFYNAINAAGVGGASFSNLGTSIRINNSSSGSAPLPSYQLYGGSSTTIQSGQSASSSGDVNATLNTITLNNHGYSSGDRIRLTTTGTLPAPLVTGTDYYVIKADNNTLKLATSSSNALANTAIDITSVGNGTHIISNYSLSSGISSSSSNSTSYSGVTLDLSSTQGARTALDATTSKLNNISTELSNIGAFRSRLLTSLNNLQSLKIESAAAAARITSSDIAIEAASLSRQQILQEVSSSLLGQANQSQQVVLSLLRNI